MDQVPGTRVNPRSLVKNAIHSRSAQSERWNEFELPKLSLRELLALAKLLGCPSHGSKETVIVRLLAQRELRLKLARFTDNPEELAISYKRESLRDIAWSGLGF